MSILIEAFTLVFAQSRVNESYPGGVAAFMEDLRRSAIPIRHVIADDHLVGVSVRSIADADAVAARIWQTTGEEPESDRALGSALWDQRVGWIYSGDWLDYAHHDDYSWISCWIVGAEPGELAAPENWTPDRTRRMECHLLTARHE